MRPNKLPLLQEKLRLSRLALQQSLQAPPQLRSKAGAFLGNLLRKKAGSRNKLSAVSAGKASGVSINTLASGVEKASEFSTKLFSALSIAEKLTATMRWLYPVLALGTVRPALRNCAKKNPWTLLILALGTGAGLVFFYTKKRPSK